METTIVFIDEDTEAEYPFTADDWRFLPRAGDNVCVTLGDKTARGDVTSVEWDIMRASHTIYVYFDPTDAEATNGEPEQARD